MSRPRPSRPGHDRDRWRRPIYAPPHIDRIHSRAFSIHTYDTDFRGRALPVSILSFLQEAASEHAALLGLSVTGLMKDGLTWVLSRYQLRVSRYPAIGEAIGITPITVYDVSPSRMLRPTTAGSPPNRRCQSV